MLIVGNNTNIIYIITTSNYNNNTSIKYNKVLNLASSKVNLNSIINLNSRVRVIVTI